MALISFTCSSSFSRTPFPFSQNPKPISLPSLHFKFSHSSPIRFPSLRFRFSAAAAGDTGDADKSSSFPAKISDDWGEDYDPEAESSTSKLPDSDPPKNEDEWQEGDVSVDVANGSPVAAYAATEVPSEEVPVDGGGEFEGLKRALVDTVYGTELGFRAGSEIRAEVSELVTQLEAANPTPNPVEEPGLLNGNWVLLYTSSSELLPLLAAGTLPLLKVDKISQTIDTDSSTIINSITISSPFASSSFSASASFEVRSPSRIQVTFKEGTLEPPEIKSKVELPETVDIFGQKLSLQPLQQSLGPLQNVVENIARIISGQQPLSIPIPGERTSSWLITTYLDGDLRISRGDGGLFVLAKEGSSLLHQ
ncbi:hypothetical protein Lal_00007370 [Lupinus albus]|uniref:Putative plastid lipid-associated protein/fibrillin n=1 Tax=Lupinus albus TaxID=3870 RepID=A0A6A4P5F5_LUPAL|nr:putative plastid lipid-associated protein/fibrillin [Lupinus albus]KAF1874756.1 hypothetical protein Lal_00007370 [Lupinus albus]